MEILRLNLLSPIYYVPVNGLDPFAHRGGEAENLFCFELNKTQRLSIEPDKKTLLGALVFGGKAAGAAPEKAQFSGSGEAGETLIELPRGNYLFAQKRETLCREGIIGMAVEIQTEGLWQRLKIGETLYLRYLFQGGQGLTQLFRPYSDEK
jgi:hypothetical protein